MRKNVLTSYISMRVQDKAFKAQINESRREFVIGTSNAVMTDYHMASKSYIDEVKGQ